MRILLHGLNFAPELTGVGKYTAEMAEWLVSRGHQVRVVTAPPYYPEWRIDERYRAWLYRKERWRGLTIRRCPLWVPSRPGGLKRLLHLLSFAVFSVPVMLGQLFWRPRIVWVAAPTLFSAPSAWLVAQLSGSHAWLHIQDFELDAAFELDLLQGSALRGLAAAWERWVMRRFDRVSTISDRMLERAARKGVRPERLLLFPNWVDLATVEPPEGPNPFRLELGLSPDDVVALYSGTMGRKQGLDLLAESARRLQRRLGLVFVFCGNGPGREELVTRCQGLPNVRFLDLQPVESLGALLALADIHLLPQQADAADLVMPSKLTGILASGRPVVATCAEETQLARVVEDRGLAVPPGDATALAEGIWQLATDKDLRLRLGNNALAYAREHLSRDVVLARFEKDLEDLANQRKRA